MSRFLSVLLGAVIAFSASSANAAFTFSFDSGSLVDVLPGYSGSFNVDIAGTGADAAGGFGYSFTLTSSNSDFTFTPSNTFNSGAFTPGSVLVNFSVAPGAAKFDTATVTGVFSAAGPGGAVFGSPFSNSLTLTAVPEPSSMALVGLCAVGAIAFNRRRLRRKA